jgi:hypothetical protein
MTIIQSIFSEFKTLVTNSEKIAFLQTLQTLNLPYDINYENLITFYQNRNK